MVGRLCRRTVCSRCELHGEQTSAGVPLLHFAQDLNSSSAFSPQLHTWQNVFRPPRVFIHPARLLRNSNAPDGVLLPFALRVLPCLIVFLSRPLPTRNPLAVMVQDVTLRVKTPPPSPPQSRVASRQMTSRSRAHVKTRTPGIRAGNVPVSSLVPLTAIRLRCICTDRLGRIPVVAEAVDPLGKEISQLFPLEVLGRDVRPLHGAGTMMITVTKMEAGKMRGVRHKCRV